MPLIHLTTFIAAPMERVFDLSLSIDLHKDSMAAFGETPVSGTRSGLIKKDEFVVWQARHLMKQRFLKVKVTELQRPVFFIDEQVEGDFKRMKHEHYFKQAENGIFMIDQFHYEVKFGNFGKWFTRIYFNRYLERLLEQRNEMIKKVAESDQWKKYLQKQ
jgi:ligand-binding SRPBCC domain-containing protein